jgi:hypothetical protein
VIQTQSAVVTSSRASRLRTPNHLGSRFARTTLIYSSPNVTLDVQVSQPILTIQSGCSSMIKSRTIGVLNVDVVCFFLSLFHVQYPLHSTLATIIASQNTDVQSTSSTSKVTQMPPTTTTRSILRCRDVSRIQGGGGVRVSLINIYLSVCENHEKNTLHSTFLVCSTLNLLVISR